MTDARFYFGTVCIQSGHATNRATAPGVWIPKMWVWEGAIDGTHTSSDILLKNDQNNKHFFHFGKVQFEIYFLIYFKHHRNRISNSPIKMFRNYIVCDHVHNWHPGANKFAQPRR